MLFGGGFVAQAFATGFPTFALANVASQIGSSPQHPVGNGLLAEQFPPERRGFAISAHITGGNVGTVVVALLGAPIIAAFGWRGAAIVFGLPTMAIAIAILLLLRERGSDRAAAVAGGSVRNAFRGIVRDRDLRWLYLVSILGGGGRGLGVVNLFALLYLTKVIGLGESLSGLMYGALIVFSVPMPLVAGWLSDRIGRKPLIVGVYLGGAIGFLVFLASGSNLLGLWAGIVLMGLFSFAESPQLQALLADVARPSVRDASFAAYFTLASGVGSLWVAVYGAIIGAAGNTTGLPIVFGLMAVTFVSAALGTLPIRAEQRAHENAAHEASLGHGRRPIQPVVRRVRPQSPPVRVSAGVTLPPRVAQTCVQPSHDGWLVFPDQPSDPVLVTDHEVGGPVAALTRVQGREPMVG